MPKTNKILLKLEGFKYATSLDLIWDMITSDLAKAQAICVQLFYHEENINISVYQWELLTEQIYSNRNE